MAISAPVAEAAMDTVLHPEILRMFERVLVVLGGILAIYLGYRLFRIATLEDRSAGKFNLHNILEFSVSRVGPGVFFAAFGAWVLYTSLTTRISTPVASSSATSIQSPISSKLIWDFDSAETDRNLEELKALIAKLPPDEASRANSLLDSLRYRFGGSPQMFFYGNEYRPPLFKDFMLPHRYKG
jgi:hypothetical protein